MQRSAVAAIAMNDAVWLWTMLGVIAVGVVLVIVGGWRE